MRDDVTNESPRTELYTLSLHDALPIYSGCVRFVPRKGLYDVSLSVSSSADRKSTRLNSSHQIISYAVYCLKNKTSIATAEQHTSELQSHAELSYGTF